MCQTQKRAETLDYFHSPRTTTLPGKDVKAWQPYPSSLGPGVGGPCIEGSRDGL